MSSPEVCAWAWGLRHRMEGCSLPSGGAPESPGLEGKQGTGWALLSQETCGLERRKSLEPRRKSGAPRARCGRRRQLVVSCTGRNKWHHTWLGSPSWVGAAGC